MYKIVTTIKMLNEYQIFYIHIEIYDATFSLDAASCALFAVSSVTRFRFRQAAIYMVGAIGKIPDKPSKYNKHV